MQVSGHTQREPDINALRFAAVEKSTLNAAFSAAKQRRSLALSRIDKKSIRIIPARLLAANLQPGSSLMDQISVLAAAGMQSRMQSLDLVANNLANSSTSGYKTDGEFYTLFTSESTEQDPDTASSVPMIQRQWTDFGQGLLEPTNNPLDFGLSGKGFFVVQGPSGPLYTRNGNFRFSTDGNLVTGEGYPLLDENKKRIRANTSQPLEVSRDGVITQNGNSLGRISLVDFSSPAGLSKFGATYFVSSGDESPTAAANTQIYQGKIETSNVNASHGAVRIVGLSRQFEMMQKAISLSNDMGKKAIEEVAKV